MEMQEFNFTIKDDPASQLLELLCGQVFHVTRRTSYPEIIKTGAYKTTKMDIRLVWKILNQEKIAIQL